MKSLGILLLTLCVLLSFQQCWAEETDPFIPGAITMHLLRQSLEHGRHASADISGIFVPGEKMASDPEEAELLSALSDLLSNSALRLGYARTAEGLRLEIGGYCLGEDSIAFSDNAVTFNKTGIIVDSDLMDGRRVTVLWETVLRYLGVDEGTAAAVLSLREEDLSAVLHDLVNKHLPVLMQMAGDTAMPYAAAALEWFASLPVQNVEQISGYDNPAVYDSVTLTRVTIHRKDFLRLADDLLSQLEHDDVLLPLLDTALSSSALQAGRDGSGFQSAEELLSALHSGIAEEAAKEGEEGLITVTYGFADTPIPFIVCIDGQSASGDETVRFLLCGAPGEGDEQARVTALLTAVTEDNTVSFTADSLLSSDTGYPLTAAVDISCSLELNGQPLFSTEFKEKLTPFVAESGQPGYRDEQNAVTTVAVSPAEEDEALQTVRSVTEATTEWVRSEDGGEGVTVHGISDLYTGENSVSTIADASFTIEPTEGGLFDATAYETLSLPSLNVDSIGFIALIAADDYIPLTDSFQTIAWEDMSGKERDELQSDILNSARIKRDQLLEAMPAALRSIATEYIGGYYDEESGMPSQEGYLDGFAEGYATGYDDGFRAGYEAATGRPFPAEMPENDTAEGSPET